MKPYYVVQWKIFYPGCSESGWDDARDSHLFGNKFKSQEEAADRMRFVAQHECRIIKRTDEVVRVKKGKKK